MQTEIRIVERSNNWSSKSLPLMQKKKFLCPSDISIGQFLSVIRKRIDIPPHIGLFLFVNNKTLPSSSDLLGDIYDTHQHPDGFLYIVYATESVFG